MLGRSFPATVLPWALLCSALAAQTLSPDNAGYGAHYREFELDPQTGNVLHLGVAVAGTDGHVFVSATGPLGAPPHLFYEFDATGGLLGVVPQPAAQDNSPLGMRDLEFDGQSLLGGSEVGISVCSRTGALVNVVLAANGPQPVVQPIAGAMMTQLAVARALALDPQGDAGNGSLFVADFGSPILECTLSGAVLRSIPNGGWSAYGLALDPVTRNLWVNADNNGNLAEIDRVTGALTGHTLPALFAGAAPGGLAVASGAAGHHERWSSEFLLAELAQGATVADRVAIARVHLLPGLRGWDEPVLKIGTNGGPLARGVADYQRLDRLDLLVAAAGGRGNGTPCWTILNFNGEAAVDGYTDLSPLGLGLGLLPEARFLSSLSSPTTAIYGVLSHVVGTPASIQLPAPFVVHTGDLVRVQTMYLEPLSPQVFGVTNKGNFAGTVAEHGIVVAAAGPNSFNANVTTPFWTVSSDTTHTYGAIQWVELSFAGASGPASLQRFDLDQIGMNDRFDGGNSTLPGAHGTYRFGSDVACGLDYSAPGVYVDPALHLNPGESCGAIATLMPGFTVDASTLRFQFTAFAPGNTFAFDCDTDGGLPGGDGQVGTIVRIGTANSGVLTGVLQQDPARADRAVVFFP